MIVSRTFPRDTIIQILMILYLYNTLQGYKVHVEKKNRRTDFKCSAQINKLKYRTR